MINLIAYVLFGATNTYIPRQYCERDGPLYCCADKPITVKLKRHGPRGGYVSAEVVLSGTPTKTGGKIFKTPTFCHMDYKYWMAGKAGRVK